MMTIYNSNLLIQVNKIMTHEIHIYPYHIAKPLPKSISTTPWGGGLKGVAAGSQPCECAAATAANTSEDDVF